MNFKSKKGVAALVTVLSLGGLIFTISMGSVIISFWANQNIKSIADSNKVFYAAQSGLQDTLIKLERNKDYNRGFNISINSTNDVSVSVSNINNSATITSTAQVGSVLKSLQLVVEIATITAFITPTSTSEIIATDTTTTTTVPPQYYCDNDDDGHYTTTTYLSCTGSSRISPAGDDCDDSNISIYPGTSGGSTCSICNSDGTITYQTSVQDLFNECGTTDCYTGNCGGTGYVCGYNTTGDGNCAACKTCVGATNGTCLNYTDNTQDTDCNSTCQACQSGSCGVANVATDPGSQCVTTECYTGNCKGTTAVCGWNTTGDGNCVACKTCVGATSGSCVNYGDYNEDTDCVSVCKGCSGGSCVNIPNASQDTWGTTTCTAAHYRCNGAGSCTAPTTTACYSSYLGSGSNKTFDWICSYNAPNLKQCINGTMGHSTCVHQNYACTSTCSGPQYCASMCETYTY